VLPPCLAFSRELELQSEPLGVSCDSLATEKFFEWNGSFKIDLVLFAKEIPTTELAHQVVLEQIRYWQGPYPYKHQTRGILQLKVDPSTVSVEIQKIEKVTYGSSFEIKLPANFLKDVSRVNASDPALVVHYRARARMLICAQTETPFPKIITLPLPNDPYLFFWSLPAAGKRNFEAGKTLVKTNPCSTWPQLTAEKPDAYPEFWNPKRFRFDDRNEFFNCESLLKGLFFDARISEAPAKFQENISQLGQHAGLESLLSRVAWTKLNGPKTSISTTMLLPFNGVAGKGEIEAVKKELQKLKDDNLSTQMSPQINLLLKNLKYILQRLPESTFESRIEPRGLVIELKLKDKDPAIQSWNVTYLVTSELSVAVAALKKSLQEDRVTIYVGDRLSEPTHLLKATHSSSKLIVLLAPQQSIDLPKTSRVPLLGSDANGIELLSTPGIYRGSEAPLNLIFASLLSGGTELIKNEPGFIRKFFAPRPHYVQSSEEFFFRLERLSWSGE
jgi:hypothetical protein